jgi:hypothetical protein
MQPHAGAMVEEAEVARRALAQEARHGIGTI